MINDLISALALVALASTLIAAILKEHMLMNDYEEWAAAVHDMTEIDRHTTQTEIRHSQGLCGDPEDEAA